MTAINKIESMHKLKFSFGSASHELYEASGVGEDWVKAVAQVNHSFVIELKPQHSDTPESGFELPEHKILEASVEMYNGFLEYMKTFLPNYKIDAQVLRACKRKLNEMNKDVENILSEIALEPNDGEDFEPINN